MKEAGFEIIGEGLRNKWNPDKDSKETAVQFGREIAKG
jgi:flavorubredoxin